jgi:hypothetical protein
MNFGKQNELHDMKTNPLLITLLLISFFLLQGCLKKEEKEITDKEITELYATSIACM